jgi:hypothetical protein
MLVLTFAPLLIPAHGLPMPFYSDIRNQPPILINPRPTDYYLSIGYIIKHAISNYRMIIVGHTFSKIYAKVLHFKLSRELERRQLRAGRQARFPTTTRRLW